MNYKILKTPHLTEKSMVQKEANNTVTFLVEAGANKTEIKKTIQKIFGVTVLDVRTARNHSKVKRLGKFEGVRPIKKKAIITLKAGDKIEYFEGA